MSEAQTNKPTRTFPRTCLACRQKRVVQTTIDREMTLKHDGTHHEVMVRDLPVEKCENCEHFTVGNDGDAQIGAALRAHLGLLAPAQIRSSRKALRLTQEALASAIGCASESVCRWESGWIVQSIAYDRWLRAFFALPELRDFFTQLNTTSAQQPAIAIPILQPASEPAGLAAAVLYHPYTPGAAFTSGGFIPKQFLKNVNLAPSAASPVGDTGAQYPRMASYDKHAA